MPKTIQLTLNNSGSDPGPYNIFLIDNTGTTTQWSTVVTKQQLISGYTLSVPDNIIKVNVKSKSANNCNGSADLTIPTTKCPCRRIKFKGVSTLTAFTFYECGKTTSTTLNISNIEVIRCVDTYQPITKVGAGTYQDTLECCT